MLDELFALSRKAAESSLQMQQVMFKQWTENWVSIAPSEAGISADWGGTMKKRWVELTIEAMNKQRESIDSTYRAGIQMVEQLTRVSEAKSAEESARAVEGLWRKAFEGVKGQMENQFREFQSWIAKSFEVAGKAATAQRSRSSAFLRSNSAPV